MFQNLLTLDTEYLIAAQTLIPAQYAHFLAISGEFVVIWVALLLVGSWLYGAFKKDNSYKLASLHIFGLIAAVFIIYSIINFGIPQWRPHPSLVLQGMNIAPLIPHPTDNSFPSGHALFSTAAIAGIVLYIKNPIITTITILLATITLSSRVLGGVHYPGDILGGIFFGLIGVLLFKNITHKIIEKIAPKIIKIASYLKL